MSSDDLANWAFAYVLIGAVIWALMYRPADDGGFRRAAVTLSIGVIVLWPVALAGICVGAYRAWRRRHAV